MSGRRQSVTTVMWAVAFILAGSPAFAGDGSASSHYGFSGVIHKIRSGVLFVKTSHSLQARAISPNKADRVGLHQAKTGEPVVMMVDSGNVLLDVARADRDLTGHRMIAGTLRYADPFWSEIQLSTPEGFERFEVDTLAGSKLSVFQEGTPVTVELDADNMLIDIQRAR
jgi:hypothetical protein